MAFSRPAGFISAFFDPLKNPNAPTIGTATDGGADSGSASVSFTAPANVGGSAITAYYAVSNPGQITSTGATSPVTVTGLSTGTAYTFQVWALNSFGPGVWSAASGSVTPSASRALVAGGTDAAGSNQSVIDTVAIASTGNATSFGNLNQNTYAPAGCASTTRGLFAAGQVTDAASTLSSISYTTIATTGSVSTFGYLTARRYSMMATNSTTRAVFAGGLDYTGNTPQTGIEYVTIASLGNTTSFGDFSDAMYGGGGCGSSTRGIFAGGDPGAPRQIHYITIATTGSAATFGLLGAYTWNYAKGASNSTTALYTGAIGNSIIEYITIATTGNAATFGNLSASTYGLTAFSNSTRAVFAGGITSTKTNAITFISFSSPGTTTSFGALTVARSWLTSCSNASGGVQ